MTSYLLWRKDAHHFLMTEGTLLLSPGMLTSKVTSTQRDESGRILVCFVLQKIVILRQVSPVLIKVNFNKYQVT